MGILNELGRFMDDEFEEMSKAEILAKIAEDVMFSLKKNKFDDEAFKEFETTVGGYDFKDFQKATNILRSKGYTVDITY